MYCVLCSPVYTHALNVRGVDSDVELLVNKQLHQPERYVLNDTIVKWQDGSGLFEFQLLMNSKENEAFTVNFFCNELIRVLKGFD